MACLMQKSCIWIKPDSLDRCCHLVPQQYISQTSIAFTGSLGTPLPMCETQWTTGELPITHQNMLQIRVPSIPNKEPSAVNL